MNQMEHLHEFLKPMLGRIPENYNSDLNPIKVTVDMNSYSLDLRLVYRPSDKVFRAMSSKEQSTSHIIDGLLTDQETDDGDADNV